MKSPSISHQVQGGVRPGAPRAAGGRQALAGSLAATGLAAGYLAMRLEFVVGRFDTLAFLLTDPEGRLARARLAILACGAVLSLLALTALFSWRLALGGMGLALLIGAGASGPLGRSILAQDRGLEESLVYRIRGLADVGLVGGLFLVFLAVLPGVLAASAGPFESALRRLVSVGSAWWGSTTPALRRGLLAGAVFAAAVVLGQGVLQNFPNSSDENSYLTQARIFDSGRLWVPAPPHPEYFRARSFVMDVERGRFFAKAFPGWAAVLSLGVKAGVPQLVNPAISALTVALFAWVAASLLGPAGEAPAVALLAATPFFLFNAASYFNHPLTLLLVTAFLAAVLRLEEGGAARWALVAGAAAGAALTVRPASALLLTAPFLAWLSWRWIGSRRWGHLAALALPIGAFVGVLGLYNTVLFGAPWRTGYQAYDPSDIRPGFGIDNFAVTGWWLVKLALWTLPASLAGIYFLTRRNGAAAGAPRRTLLALMGAALLLHGFAHLVFQNKGSNEYGPRYYLDGFAFLVLLMAAGWQRLLTSPHGGAPSRARRGALLGGAAAFALTLLLTLPLLSFHYRDKVTHNRDLFTSVEATGMKSALVLLQTGSGRMPPGDLVRNPLDFRSGIVYARDLGQEGRRQLTALYSDRIALVYSYDPFLRRSRLEPLDRVESQ